MDRELTYGSGAVVRAPEQGLWGGKVALRSDVGAGVGVGEVFALLEGDPVLI